MVGDAASSTSPFPFFFPFAGPLSLSLSLVHVCGPVGCALCRLDLNRQIVWRKRELCVLVQLLFILSCNLDVFGCGWEEKRDAHHGGRREGSMDACMFVSRVAYVNGRALVFFFSFVLQSEGGSTCCS